MEAIAILDEQFDSGSWYADLYSSVIFNVGYESLGKISRRFVVNHIVKISVF